MIWNIAEFITWCVNKRGAHPGVHVGLDLIATGLLASGGAIAIIQWTFLWGGRGRFRGLGTAAAVMELLAW